MNMKHAMRCAAASLAVVLSSTVAYAAGDPNVTATDSSTTKAQTSEPMTGKEKATAIGATTGAVAGAVVGGPVGAVVGAGIGGYVGHEGTDANGKVASASAGGSTVRSAQVALNEKGYDVGTVDGQYGPNTSSAVRRFQAEHGLAQTGALDSATLSALGVNH